MDIKDFEKQLETINSEITLHFLNAKTKAEESSEKIYKMLDGSLDIKKSVLDIMENELERVISAYLTELNQIEANIQSLELNIHNLTDLEAKEKVLNQEIEDNMKPYIASQKKKKAELA
ncbi:MAG: hypothetical protein PHX62_06885, partial [Bacilli bacterium]|nr:hypothetical protein [Bacilli bacterium]